MPIAIAEALAPHRRGQRDMNAKLGSKVSDELMPAGHYAVQGSDDDHGALPTSAAEVAAGLGVIAYAPLSSEGDANNEVAAGVPFQYVKRGLVVVQVEEAVTAGLPAFVRHTANGGNTQLGRFRSDADTANATQIPARYATSTSGAGLAVLDINLPSA